MHSEALGKKYMDGELIVKQGEKGNCMFVIQDGSVQVTQSEKGKDILIAELKKGDFFGEMALFENEVRSATVRAKGEVVALTIDKKILLRKIQQDPTLAFNLLEKMSSRIRALDHKHTKIKAADRRDWDFRTGIKAGN